MKKRWMVSLMAVAMAVSMGGVRQKFGAAQKWNAGSSAPAGTTAAEAGASGETYRPLMPVSRWTAGY